jgi:uncharacterized protein
LEETVSKPCFIINGFHNAIDVRENIVQDRKMNKASIMARLRAHEAELKAAGVKHLFLHGSYARGTMMVRRSSDVDIIAEFDPSRRFSLLDMVAIENRLTDLLGVSVDLSPAKFLKEPVAAKTSREAVLAF